MNITKEYRLSLDRSELYERTLDSFTKMPISDWAVMSNEKFELLMEYGRYKLVTDFNDTMNDLWNITPEHNLPKLLQYYRTKLEFMQNPENYTSLEYFKQMFIQHIAEKYNL